MNSKLIQFGKKDENLSQQIKIAIVGCGGGGSNSVNRLHTMGIVENFDRADSESPVSVETIIINTDIHHLNMMKAHKKFLIGRAITHGNGCGGKLEIGEKAAENSRRDIMELLEDKDLVFITVGLGGGTGTGVAPMVAEIAKDNKCIVIVMATIPFSFERQRRAIAEIGLRKLKECADCVLIFENDRIRELGKDYPIDQAFAFADTHIGDIITSIINILYKPGLINIDFADFRTVFKNYPGDATILYGEGPDDDIEQILDDIFNNPIHNTDFAGAKAALIHITGSSNLTLEKRNIIIERLTKDLDNNANIIIGDSVNTNTENMVTVFSVISGIKNINLPVAKGSAVKLEKISVKC